MTRLRFTAYEVVTLCEAAVRFLEGRIAEAEMHLLKADILGLDEGTRRRWDEALRESEGLLALQQLELELLREAVEARKTRAQP